MNAVDEKQKIDERGQVWLKYRGVYCRKRLNQYSIVYAELGEGVLHEKSGARPCLILSNNMINNRSTNVVVAPLTKYENKYGKGISPGDAQVFISNKHYGEMRFSSIIQMEDIRSISKNRITEYLFDLQGRDIKLVKEAEKYLLGL